MAASAPFIFVRETTDRTIVSGLTSAAIFRNTGERFMFSTPNSIHWNDLNPDISEPTWLSDVEPALEIFAIDKVNGGGSEAFIEVELFYKKVKLFDKNHNGL